MFDSDHDLLFVPFGLFLSHNFQKSSSSNLKVFLFEQCDLPNKDLIF